MTMEKYFFIVEVSQEFISRERERAKALKKSKWWQRKLSQGICYYCGRKFPPSELTMDHVVPIIRGGRSTRGNIVPACKDCNNKKKYLLPIEWDEYLNQLKSSRME